MKNLLVLLLFVGLITSCDNPSQENNISTDLVQNPATASNETGELPNQKYPVMQFEQELHEFGTIAQGEKIRRVFKFKNTGDANLLITSATSSCGCTIPKWPKHPIKPGEGNEIEVVFDSDGKIGHIHKKVTIVANTNPAKVQVAISGDVIGPGEKQ